MASIKAETVGYSKVRVTISTTERWSTYNLSMSPNSYPWHINPAAPEIPDNLPENGHLQLPVSIPPGVTATVMVDAHSGQDAYLSLWGLEDDAWHLVDTAVCSLPKDLGSTRALMDAVPNTVHTGGQTYGVRDSGAPLEELLSSFGEFMDRLKTDLYRLSEHPGSFPDRHLNVMLKTLGGFPLSDPGAARRLLPVIRSAATRKGSAEALEEVLSAVTGVVVQVRRTSRGDVAVDNLVLNAHSSNPGTPFLLDVDPMMSDDDAEVDENGLSKALGSSGLMSLGLWAEVQEIDPDEVPVVLTGHRPPLVTHAWTLSARENTYAPRVFGTRVHPLDPVGENLPYLIPVEEDSPVTVSAYSTGDIAIGLRWYRVDGTWISPEPDHEELPAVGGTDDDSDNMFADTPDSWLDQQRTNTFLADSASWSSGSEEALGDWVRFYTTEAPPAGARYVSWHVLSRNNSEFLLWGVQATQTDAPVTYRDPRSFTALALPRRVNLAPGGGCSSDHGWERTSGTGEYLVGAMGNHSSASLLLTAGSHRYPVAGGSPMVRVRAYASASLDLRTWRGSATATVKIQGCPEKQVSLTEEWQTVTLSGMPPEVDGSRPVVIEVSCGSDVVVDNVLIEAGSDLTGPFFNGNSPGGVWSGDPDGSSSGMYPGPDYLLQVARDLVDDWSPMQTRGNLALFEDPILAEIHSPTDADILVNDPNVLVDDEMALVGGGVGVLVNDEGEFADGTSQP